MDLIFTVKTIVGKHIVKDKSDAFMDINMTYDGVKKKIPIPLEVQIAGYFQ